MRIKNLLVAIAFGVFAFGTASAWAGTVAVDYYTTGSFSGGTGGIGSLTYASTSNSASVTDNDFTINYDFGGSLASPTSVSLNSNGTPLALPAGSFGGFVVTGVAPFTGSINNVAFTLEIYQVVPGVVGSGQLAASVSGQIFGTGGQFINVNFSPSSTVSSSLPPILYTVGNLDYTNSLSAEKFLVAHASVVPLPSTIATLPALLGAVGFAGYWRKSAKSRIVAS